MKKSVCMLLASVLLVFALTGCQSSEKSSAFETLSVTFSGEKTLSMEMNQEEVQTVMGKEPDKVEEMNGTITARWDLEDTILVDYKEESPCEVTRISLSLADIDFETSLGIAKGDSVTSMQEKLGDLYIKSESDDETSYFYAFRYADGQYEIVDSNNTIGDITGGSSDVGVYSATFICEDDQVTKCYFTDLLS